MAVDGVLLVYSVCNRFSDEEKAAISILQDLFGKEICDYMIVVFTCGDELEEDGMTLEDFICECPQAFKNFAGHSSTLWESMCFFYNMTKDQTKKSNQVKRLLAVVNKVLDKNSGEPYINDIFNEMKKRTKEHQGRTKDEEDVLKHFIEMIDLKLKNLRLKFERDLLEEQTARLREEVKKAQYSSGCVIL